MLSPAPSSPRCSVVSRETVEASGASLAPSLESLPPPTLACLRVLESLSRRERNKASSAAEEECQGETGGDLLSFCAVHQLLQDANALDTPAKYAHMFHALCVAADRRLEAVSSALREERHASACPTVDQTKKRRRLHRQTSADDLDEEGRSSISEGRREGVSFPDGHGKGHGMSSEEDFIVEKVECLDEDEDQENLSPNHSSRHQKRRHASGGDERGEDSIKEQEISHSSSTTEVRKQQLRTDPPHREVVIDHVAGFLLGTLEGLKPPPALGADEFLESVSHVLCRVLYMHRPTESSDLASCDVDRKVTETGKTIGFSVSDVDHHGKNSFVAETAASFTSAEACRNRWRRHIVQRFTTVEQLLLSQGRNPEDPVPKTPEGMEKRLNTTGDPGRSRRALRIVRHWASFVLELEMRRRKLIERVMKTSEEAQGLTHMLLGEPSSPQGRDSEEKGREGERKKKTLVVIAGMEESTGEEEAEARGPGVSSTLEDRLLECRIKATQQLLRLPSLPPFSFPRPAVVADACARFERCLSRWQEDRTRRKLAEENAMKKTQAAAMIVSYVNERMQEQEKASAAVNVALPGSAAAMTALLRQRSVCHPFYLLGLNPQTATVQAVETVRKKWRVFLHPDKFHSIPHLLHQATEAFKVFQLAIDEALQTLSQRRIDSGWSPPPPPPDPSCTTSSPSARSTCQAPSPASSRAPPSQGSPLNTPDPPLSLPLPTRRFSPDFSVEIAPRRKSLGVFFVYVPSTRDSAFAEITEIRVYVHRPIQGGPPGALLPSPEALSSVLTKTVSLTSAMNPGEDGQAAAEEKIQIVDAVQPLELGEERTYWVGVQVQGKKKDYSLIRWKPVCLRLALPPAVNVQDATAGVAGSSSSASEKDEYSNVAAELRALVAFLSSFSEAPFLDAGTRAKVVQSSACLKRLLVYFSKRRARKDGGEGGRNEILSEYSYSTKDARQLLQSCIEKAKIWADRSP